MQIKMSGGEREFPIEKEHYSIAPRISLRNRSKSKDESGFGLLDRERDRECDSDFSRPSLWRGKKIYFVYYSMKIVIKIVDAYLSPFLPNFNDGCSIG